MKMTRRHFIGSSAAAVLVAGTMAKGKVFGANERIGIAVMGFGGRGGEHIKAYLADSRAEIVALCDVDRNILQRGAKVVADKQGAAPKTYADIRELLADEAVDAVSMATPNHWHSLGAVWACQANKHVYVEKPMSHSVWEGRQVIAAAKKFNRIVMHGTQQRSDGGRIRDMRLMREGIIGKIIMARGTVYKKDNRVPIGHGKPGQVPETLDYNLWLGPAPERPYMVKAEDPERGLFVPYDWHWFWDFGNGEIGNQGVHQMDVACWAADKGLPVKVYSSGGRYAWDDDGETPNTQSTTFTYEDGTLLEFEVRNLGSFTEGDDADCSNSAFGTDGYWVAGKGFFEYKGRKPLKVEQPNADSEGEFGNFVKAVLSGKPEDNFAPPEVAHIPCVHIHLANIAYRLGRSLAFDPKTERFVNDDEANAMVKQQYRDPFVVPEIG